jgi:hypothetical protein
MRTNYYIIIIITAFILLSCKESTVEPFVDTNNYFPMQVGNTWWYSLPNEAHDQFKISITGVSSINSKQYFIFERLNISTNQKTITYYCFENKKVFQYKPDTQKESLFIDFNKNIDEIWISEIREYDTLLAKITEKNYSDITTRGKFSHCLNIYYCSSKFAEGGWTNLTFAPGIGLIEEFPDCPGIRLDSAVVNGVNYLKN